MSTGFPAMTSRRTMSLIALAAALSACGTPGDAPRAPTHQEMTMQSPVLDRFKSPVAGFRSGGRIAAAEVPTLRAAGIRHVINLAPASETPGFDEAAAVRGAGMRYDALPIAGAGDLDREAVLAFDELLQAADGPALVHCGSGNRVGALVALRAAWLQGADDASAVEEGRRWGLGGLEGEVRQRIARERCLADAGDADGGPRCNAAG
ncbi:sulfur transferase domain-containing protein [Luteimonas sp. MC1750]|uniref:beta-lactamase hydrolase domain-containing protein n=1 Tax=Luteimonas sp. MC1750 TaxID=2799326 RepID=UPI001F45CE9A|nr:sulfur transferase domain-containing protein [Luteimonas sp. MC1750]